ncbi:hypothetical protein CSKR_105269 [Clonorchis sinensis]|uniref:Uncharacterized protein n=1 Tax=Clonorchis sinensis TaxID=79923 RepID=A0A3R7CAQ5_CLOSI|nr:hypothetical protein CSKR_105269 [Clonorchis sinensis]
MPFSRLILLFSPHEIFKQIMVVLHRSIGVEHLCYAVGDGVQRLERERTDRKVRGSNPASASRLPLSRLGQPGSIPAIVLPSGGMAARHRKDATAERNWRLSNYEYHLLRQVLLPIPVVLDDQLYTAGLLKPAGAGKRNCSIFGVFLSGVIGIKLPAPEKTGSLIQTLHRSLLRTGRQWYNTGIQFDKSGPTEVRGELAKCGDLVGSDVAALVNPPAISLVVILLDLKEFKRQLVEGWNVEWWMIIDEKTNQTAGTSMPPWLKREMALIFKIQLNNIKHERCSLDASEYFIHTNLICP